MNPDQLKAYKREKSRLFNAKSRELRLKDKENQLFQKVESKVEPNQIQPDNLQDDNLTIQDVMDIFETLDTKMDIIQTKLETIMENKLYETLDTNQPINRQPSIFFA